MSQPESQLQSGIPDYGTPHIETHTPQPEPARLGPLQRLIGVLFSPGETFEDINRKPTWLAPMVIAIVLGACGSLFVNWWVNPDWNRITRDMIRQRVNKSGGEMPPEAAIQQQVKIQEVIGKFFPLGFVAIVPIWFLIKAGIYALGMMLMQAQTTFKKVLSAVAWTSCAVGAVNAVVTNASLMVRDRESFDTMNPMDPSTISATNLGVFLGSGTSPALKALASSLDLFTIWSIVLLAIGLAAIGGSRKITRRKTATLVVSLWLVVVLLSVLVALVFGGGGR
jgi:hypothetical protein